MFSGAGPPEARVRQSGRTSFAGDAGNQKRLFLRCPAPVEGHALFSSVNVVAYVQQDGRWRNPYFRQNDGFAPVRGIAPAVSRRRRGKISGCCTADKGRSLRKVASIGPQGRSMAEPMAFQAHAGKVAVFPAFGQVSFGAGAGDACRRRRRDTFSCREIFLQATCKVALPYPAARFLPEARRGQDGMTESLRYPTEYRRL